MSCSPTELRFFQLQNQLLLRNPLSTKHMESGLKGSEPQLLCLQKGLKTRTPVAINLVTR